jgi:uncharacterized protein (DUF2384 family)
VSASTLVTLTHEMHVMHEQLCDGVGIPPATVNRKIFVMGLLGLDERERVLGVAHLMSRVKQVVTQSDSVKGFDAAVWTAAWLSQPAPALGGACPGGLMATAELRTLVNSLTHQMQSGAYA